MSLILVYFAGCKTTITQFQFISIKCLCQACKLHSNLSSGLYNTLYIVFLPNTVYCITIIQCTCPIVQYIQIDTRFCSSVNAIFYYICFALVQGGL